MVSVHKQKNNLNSAAISSIVNFGSAYSFFFCVCEKILSVKKHQNAKQTNFTLSDVFVRENCCNCCFLFGYFGFASWFVLVCAFLCSKSFRKKTDTK